MYDLRFSNAAEKYFRKLHEKPLKKIFRVALEKLQVNPYIGQTKTGDLSGVYCYDVFYQKTNYEIAYRIYEEDGKMILIILAGTRENFYDELKRYMR
jgi:mRNA interferase RelE/StbE